MSAMIVAPAAAARQWTDRLGVMVILAGGLGALAGVSGAVVSSEAQRMPTGPTIVLCAGVIVIISLLLAPRRGLAWSWVRERRHRARLRLETVLADLYLLARQHGSLSHPHSEAALAATLGVGGGVRGSLEQLASRGWARRVGEHEWALTDAGRVAAERRVGGGGA
jgi:manganese/zinc/iron transport system permease protein